MKTRSDLVSAFLAAAAIHGLAGVCANSMLTGGGGAATPLFQPGISAVSLTLVPQRENRAEPRARAVEGEKDPVREPPVRVVEAAAAVQEPEAPSSAPEAIPSRSRPVAAGKETPTDAVRGGETKAGSSASDNDGDLLAKGVESFWTGLSEIRPRYPLGARVRGEEGVVGVTAEITAAGRAQNVRVTASSGSAALDRAAADAVNRAKFVARGTSPVPGRITLSFRFQLVE